MRNDYTGFVGCVISFNCAAVVDRNAPLDKQAAVQTYLVGNSSIGFWSSGAYTRLRELTVTARIPNRALRYARASAGTLTLAGRNLTYWSSWPGGDPEVNPNGTDTEYTFPAPPLPRYLIARFNLSY
jgi:hypothetical protein